MFLGEYEHAIDEKGRVTIPAKYRIQLESGLVVTKGLDRCLMAYPMDVWNELSSRASALPLTNSSAREFRRRLFSEASDSEPDKQGRIILHPRLRKYANLDSQVIIIGVYSYFEIWNPESWRERQDKGDSDPETLAELFADLGV